MRIKAPFQIQITRFNRERGGKVYPMASLDILGRAFTPSGVSLQGTIWAKEGKRGQLYGLELSL